MRCTPARMCSLWAAALAAAGAGSAGEVEEVGPFGLVELEGGTQRLQHGLGDTGQVPPFESGVVVGADTGEEGDLLAGVGH